MPSAAVAGTVDGDSLMKQSALMRRDREELIRRVERMSPEERLVAFFNHSRLLTQMYLAGARYRAKRDAQSRKKRAKKR